MLHLRVPVAAVNRAVVARNGLQTVVTVASVPYLRVGDCDRGALVQGNVKWWNFSENILEYVVHVQNIGKVIIILPKA